LKKEEEEHMNINTTKRRKNSKELGGVKDVHLVQAWSAT
jgi:hypothetical protein